MSATGVESHRRESSPLVPHSKDEAVRGYFLREEAHQMPWQQLFPPEQKAVRELINRMNAAREAATADKDGRRQLAPCFLLAGQRGTGKTTVLVNAPHALENPDRFLGQEPQGGDPDSEVSELRGSIDKLASHVIWLDALDMEFFPQGGNLLTALLVRVRSALDRNRNPGAARDDGAAAASSRAARRSGIPAQLVEEGEADAWSRIDNLIRHATVMWEQAERRTDDEDMGVKAERQIDVAQTNAEFKAELTAAIDAVVKELVQRTRGSRHGQVALVLPIDNADRSVQHISQVIKLTRLVSSPNVWYVLAGSDQDLDVFVEESYRQQLGIKDGATAGGASAGGPSNKEPKIVGIARRQAAADVRSVLPPANRIEIGCVEPRCALAFRDQSQPRGVKLSLHDIFAELEIQTPSTANQDGNEVKGNGAGKNGRQAHWKPEYLLDLLVLDDTEPTTLDGTDRRPLEKQQDASGKDAGRGDDHLCKVMSQAGELALTLPARAVLDAYQLAQMWLERQRRGREHLKDRPACASLGLARAMLENAIAESELPEWACRRLTENVLFEDGVGRVCLDLRGEPLGWCSRIRERGALNLAVPVEAASSSTARKIVETNRPEIVFHDYYGCKVFVRHEGVDEQVELPSRVAGWLMIVHDILRGIDEPRIMEDIGRHPDRDPPLLVETRHVAAIWGSAHRGWRSPHIRFAWPAPRFDTFYDYDVLARRWARVQKHFTTKPQLRAHGKIPADWCALAVLNWIDVCASVAAGQLPNTKWSVPDLLEESPVQGAPDEVSPKKLDTYLGKFIGQWTDAPEDESSRDPFEIWKREDLPFLLAPEVKWLCKPGWRRESKLGDDPWTSPLAWAAYEDRWHRFRDALKETELVKHLRNRMALPQGLKYRTLHDWLDKACRTWFEAVDKIVEDQGGPKQPPRAGWQSPRPDWGKREDHEETRDAPELSPRVAH
jgi:hypothetical protein